HGRDDELALRAEEPEEIRLGDAGHPSDHVGRRSLVPALREHSHRSFENLLAALGGGETFGGRRGAHGAYVSEYSPPCQGAWSRGRAEDRVQVGGGIEDVEVVEVLTEPHELDGHLQLSSTASSVPPRALPSSLVITSPVSLVVSWNASA